MPPASYIITKSTPRWKWYSSHSRSLPALSAECTGGEQKATRWTNGGRGSSEAENAPRASLYTVTWRSSMWKTSLPPGWEADVACRS